MSESTPQSLFSLLSDGRSHSGTELGELLGISRAGVWKVVERLRQQGLQITASRGRGYRLVRAQKPLDAQFIERALSPAAHGLIRDLAVVPAVASTSSWLSERYRGSRQGGQVCIAEYQSGGRGRGGRSWVSPYGANLYFSLRWVFPCGLSALSGFSLAVGVVLAERLQATGYQALGLKWPNDLVAQCGETLCKCGGILVEVSGEANGPAEVVVGVGINVTMPDDAGPKIEQPWTDLSRLAAAQGQSAQVNRNTVSGQLLDALLLLCDQFLDRGAEAWLSRWPDYDHLRGRAVRVESSRGTVNGKVHGIAHNGDLLLETATGLLAFSAAEVSVRP